MHIIPVAVFAILIAIASDGAVAKESGWWSSAGMMNSIETSSVKGSYRLQCHRRGFLYEYIDIDSDKARTMHFAPGDKVRVWVLLDNDNIPSKSVAGYATVISRPTHGGLLQTQFGTGSKIRESVDLLTNGDRLAVIIQHPQTGKWVKMFEMDAPPREMALDYIEREC